MAPLPAALPALRLQYTRTRTRGRDVGSLWRVEERSVQHAERNQLARATGELQHDVTAHDAGAALTRTCRAVAFEGLRRCNAAQADNDLPHRGAAARQADLSIHNEDERRSVVAKGAQLGYQDIIVNPLDQTISAWLVHTPRSWHRPAAARCKP